MSDPVVGNAIRSSVSFKDDVTGAAYDPPVVKFYSRSPTKQVANSPPVETEYVYSTAPSSNIKRTGTGDYYIRWTPTDGGRWSRKWVGIGPGDQRSVVEDEIVVKATKVRTG